MTLFLLFASLAHADSPVFTCGSVDWQISFVMDERTGSASIIADGAETLSFGGQLDPKTWATDLKRGLDASSIADGTEKLHLSIDGAKGALSLRGKDYRLICENN